MQSGLCPMPHKADVLLMSTDVMIPKMGRWNHRTHRTLEH